MIRNLHELCNIQYGYAFDSASFTDDASYTPLVRIRDVKRGYSETYYSGAYSDEYIIRAGDLLVGMDGEFNAAKWKSRDALLNQRVCKIIAKKETDGEYLRFALSVALKIIEERTAFVTVKHLSVKELNKIKIQAPSYEEQKNIAGILLRIEEIIQAKQDELRKLDSLIKARFVEMFGDFDLAPQCNEWIKLSKLGEIVSGSTPKTGTAEYWDGDICWITPAELNSMSGIVYDSKKKITEAGRNSCSLRLMPINTVILSSRAPIGKVAILGKEMCCNQGFKNIICNEKILPKYLYYLLAYNTDYLNSLGRGATFKEISKKIVEDIRISLPSIEQQAKFITFSEQVDKSKFTLQNSIISLMNLWYNINQYVCERMYGEA